MKKQRFLRKQTKGMSCVKNMTDQEVHVQVCAVQQAAEHVGQGCQRRPCSLMDLAQNQQQLHRLHLHPN